MRLFFLVLLIAAVSSGGWRKQGPIERAGERVDEVAHNVADGDPPLEKRGALEKAGEAIDDTFDGDKQ